MKRCQVLRDFLVAFIHERGDKNLFAVSKPHRCKTQWDKDNTFLQTEMHLSVHKRIAKSLKSN